ncbi:conserved hypothetical protein [Tenacibaculum sp. 190524A02b]|uniref:Uncharacterized protein n=1 Tax=Tenacibaculum vairaonense TaxID=3137860 RepID=A0ABP1FG98_9FLAO
MQTHIYGKKHFKHKTNFGDMVVFSDTLQEKIKDIKPVNNVLFVEIEKGYHLADRWFIHFNRTLSGEYGDFFLAQTPAPTGNTDKFEFKPTKETAQIIRQHQRKFNNGKVPYYTINGKNYIRLDESLTNYNVFVGDNKSKPNYNVEYDAFPTVFISEDGARLEHAYQKISQVNNHEVAVFIERNSGTNAFGTVFRLKVGKNIKTLPETDRIRISEIARAYGVNIKSTELSNMIQQELKNSNSWFYLLLLQGAQGSGKVIRWSTDITLSTLKEGVNTVSKELEQLKLGAEYWKTLTDDGKENPKFKSLLPKLTKDAIINTETFVKNTYKTYFQPLENKVSYLEKLFKQHAFLGKIIPFNTDKIVSLLQSIPELLQSFFTKVQNSLISFYNFINGLLVGLINSIIEFIKSVFDILALLIGILNGSIQSTKFFENPTSYLSLFVESIENTIDSVYNAFTKENFKKLLDFLSNLPKQAGMLLTSITNKIGNTVTDPGAIGYYLGFLVGFIASEVVTFFATGGTGNIAKALKAVLQSYKSLVKTTAKAVQKTITFSMNTFVSLVKKILEFSKNIPKHLDTLKTWVDEFIISLQAKAIVIDNVTYIFVDPISLFANSVFKLFKANAWKKLNSIGVSMLKNEEGLYTFYYNNKKLENGLNQNQAEEFLKELFTNTKDKTDDVVKKYLDDLQERFIKIKKYNFDSFPMKKKYLGENSENLDGIEHFPNKPPNMKVRWCWPYSVKYLDVVERQKYKVTIRNKKLYNNKGNLIDTKNAGNNTGYIENAIFVMDKDGTIYLSNFYQARYFHHSSFLAGASVSAAGEIKVVNGIIKEINLSSGHYEPTIKLNKQVLKILEDEFKIKNINLKNDY